MPAKQPDITMREAVRRLAPRLQPYSWELSTVLSYDRGHIGYDLEYRLEWDRPDKCRTFASTRLDMLVEDIEENWSDLSEGDVRRMDVIDAHVNDLADLTH